MQDERSTARTASTRSTRIKEQDEVDVREDSDIPSMHVIGEQT